MTAFVANGEDRRCVVTKWPGEAVTGERSLDQQGRSGAVPLHGFTFALLHLTSSPIPYRPLWPEQTVYDLVRGGGATALLTILYARFGPAGFWAMGLLCIAAFPGWCIGRFQRPMYPRLSPHIEVPLLPNLVGRIGRGLRIERLPPSLSIGCAPLRDVDRRPVNQGLEP